MQPMLLLLLMPRLPPMLPLFREMKKCSQITIQRIQDLEATQMKVNGLFQLQMLPKTLPLLPMLLLSRETERCSQTMIQRTQDSVTTLLRVNGLFQNQMPPNLMKHKLLQLLPPMLQSMPHPTQLLPPSFQLLLLPNRNGMMISFTVMHLETIPAERRLLPSNQMMNSSTVTRPEKTPAERRHLPSNQMMNLSTVTKLVTTPAERRLFHRKMMLMPSTNAIQKVMANARKLIPRILRIPRMLKSSLRSETMIKQRKKRRRSIVKQRKKRRRSMENSLRSETMAKKRRKTRKKKKRSSLF